MAQSAARSSVELSHMLISKPTDSAERKLRRVAAWLLLFLGLVTELGLAWDRNWHDLVGRDTFFTPPHVLLYSGIGGAGLIALFVVLVDTLRYYHKKPGVDDNSTIKVLQFFHAPLGFILAGFGALIDLIAAPFDNYWHILYGIDVTLWSPFHLMGSIGGIVIGLGIIFVFASEVVIERQAEHPPRRFLGLSGLEWGTLVLLAAYMNLSIPADTAFDTITLGPLQFVTYPLPLALAGGFSLVAAVKFTHKPGSATLTALLLWLETMYTMTFVPLAMHFMVMWLGLHYRFSGLPGHTPMFNVTLALLPLLFVVSALGIDGVVYWQHRQGKDIPGSLPEVWLPGVFIALSASVVPSCSIQLVQSIPALLPLPAGLEVLEPNWSSTLLTLPFVFLAGILAAKLGAACGDFWYRNNH